ncbi:DUF4148 domain-containing protein [Variovorax dokdonensis]|uniref:DUF4148 domain-containing protein n=1 Tax=Variovorax dokdonensis TaxID=344883 RepID=A0ABT7NGH3_9BURK|nr:DUF4148 domain-containing protein [Variovorax dokdonensis]MDM0047018.1 DUF4148 domain-containing protein [Variovorax dokdonensis]
MTISIRHVFAATASVAALLIAPAAFAAGAYHPEPTEAGASFNPDHVGQKSRDQVRAELAEASKQPGWDRISRTGAPWPAGKNGNGFTRGEVNADLQAAMASPSWDRVSRIGAAWPSARAAGAQAAAK